MSTEVKAESSSSPFPQTVEEKIAYAKKLKDDGNVFFTNSDYSKALSKYTKIFAFISGLKMPNSGGTDGPAGAAGLLSSSSSSPSSSPSSDQSQSIDSLTFTATSNIAACYLKLNEPKKCIEWANKALAIDEKHAKSVYRRGMAYSMIHDYEAALVDLEKAAQLNPSDTSMAAVIADVKRRSQEYDEGIRKKFASKFANADLSAKKEKKKKEKKEKKEKKNKKDKEEDGEEEKGKENDEEEPPRFQVVE